MFTSKYLEEEKCPQLLLLKHLQKVKISSHKWSRLSLYYEALFDFAFALYFLKWVSLLEKLCLSHTFCEQINYLFMCVTILLLNFFLFHHILDEVLNIKMHKSLTMDKVLCQMDGTHIITKNYCRAVLSFTYLSQQRFEQ